MTNEKHKRKGNYDVGYGRPPVAHRFKPGRSGNPAGRPRRKQSIDAAAEQALHELVSVNEEGRHRKVPALQVIMRQVRNSALRGNLPAAKFLLSSTTKEEESARPNDYSKLTDEELNQLIVEHVKKLQRYKHPVEVEQALQTQLSYSARALASKPRNPGQR
jgi:hypothetical protein